MRILHAISGIEPRNGGPTQALLGLAPAQRQAGLDVRVICTWREPEAHESARHLESLGVGVRLVGPATGALSVHRELDRAVHEEIAAADVAHVHGLYEAIQHLAVRNAVTLKKPVVFTPHGMLTTWSLGRKWLKKKLYMMLRLRRDLEQASAIHFTTSYERDLSRPLGLKAPAIVEPLGVDLAEFENLPPREAFVKKHPQLRGRRIVMFLGRIDRGKGMEYLIPAMGKVKSHEAVLVAVGPDWRDFRPAIEKLLDEHGVRDRVLFTGMLRGREKFEALAAADLFALPSEHENFGIVVVEALACGVPVIVSDHVALAGEVEEGKVGAVVPLGDIAALAGELDHWFGDKQLRQEASERARPFVKTRFDWSAIGRRWVEHYEEIVQATVRSREVAVARGIAR